jgi:hypothetical protein
MSTFRIIDILTVIKHGSKPCWQTERESLDSDQTSLSRFWCVLVFTIAWLFVILWTRQLDHRTIQYVDSLHGNLLATPVIIYLLSCWDSGGGMTQCEDEEKATNKWRNPPALPSDHRTNSRDERPTTKEFDGWCFPSVIEKSLFYGRCRSQKIIVLSLQSR